MNNTIKIYTDGACTPQHEDCPGGWGVLLMFNEFRKELFGGTLNTTNNRMEMTAVIEAMNAVNNKNMPVIIYTDSAYICNCLNKDWISGWKKNGWKTSKKQPVENQDLWIRIDNLMSLFKDIKIVKVKGHSDDDGNNIADSLAVKGKDLAINNPTEVKKEIDKATRDAIDFLNNTPADILMCAIESMSIEERKHCLDVLRKVVA